MNSLVRLFAFIVYIAGIVIAKGFWWTVGAIFIPPIGWYLIIEQLITKYNILS